ncbi:MAG: Bax inhibitor-1/YccA family membrane protein [Planctomycetota bacterium]|jgi:uncharacterized YccA/Bax inhibitor family protein
MWESSNPALRNDNVFNEVYGRLTERADTITLQGVVNRTGLLVLIAVAAGAGGYALVGTMPSILWISCIAAFIVSLGVYFVIHGKPALAPALAPLYAIVEGAFLGALTAALDGVLAQMGYAATGGLALQAFVITISILIAMLALYSFRILRPSQTFVSVIKVLTAGIMITYVLSFVLSFFGMALPFVSLGSAFAGGKAALIGLGINVFILGVASMWLIIDFKLIEDRVAEGGPKYMEWYCGFALLVTLAWIYFEAVKLAFRIAISRGCTGAP